MPSKILSRSQRRKFNSLVRAACLLTYLALVYSGLPVARGDVFRSYHIGNSLSVDSGAEWIGLRLPPEDYAPSGFHIRCSKSLTYMVENPTDVCIDDNDYPGYYTTALPAYHWDAITLQPYSGATGAQELQAAASLIGVAKQNAANINSRYYILATWPHADVINGEISVDFKQRWLAQSDTYSKTTAMVHEQGWFEWYVDELRADLPDTSIHMIPVGDVLLALDAKLRAGAYPGIDDVSDLYRDWRHLNNVGRYVSQMTMWATIHRRSPLELAWDNGFSTTTPGGHGFDKPRTEALSLLIRETVWEVLTQHQYAGVIAPGSLPGDFNGDGRVDAADYTVWRNSLGQEGKGLAADGIRNGIVDEADYWLWKHNFGRVADGALLGGNSQVPEPRSFLLAGLALAALVAARGAKVRAPRFR